MVRSALSVPTTDTRPELREAMRTLREKGIAAKQIIRVYPDRILYVSQDGKAMTAMLWRDPETDRLFVRELPGFPAD